MLSSLALVLLSCGAAGLSDTVFGTSIGIGSRTHIEWRRNDTLIATQVLDGDTTIRRDGALPPDGIRVALFRGERHTIPYRNGRPEGMAVSVDDSGGVTFETYCEGIKEGPCGTLLSSGDTLYRASWKNGMVDGAFAGWLDGHLLDEGEMYEGSGVSRRHRADGSIAYLETWVKMHRIRVVDLYPNGDTSAITDYADNDTILHDFAFGCRGFEGFFWNDSAGSVAMRLTAAGDSAAGDMVSADSGSIRFLVKDYALGTLSLSAEFICRDSLLKQIVLMVPDTLHDTLVAYFTGLYGAAVYDRQDSTGIWLESTGGDELLFANGTIFCGMDTEKSCLRVILSAGDYLDAASRRKYRP